jgi:tetratricopeptide (TPR) repeat protein
MNREAELDLARAAKLKPNDVAVRLQRGLLLTELRRWDDAVAELTAVLQVDPQNVEAMIRRALAYMYTNRATDALADLSKALEIAPNHREALLHKASALERLDEWKEAEGIYNRLLEIQPRDYVSLMRRGDCRRKQNRIQEALDDYNRSIAVSPGFVHAYAHRAHLYLALGKLDEARADYERAASLAGGRPLESTLGYASVLALFTAGKWEEGQKAAEMFVRQNRQDPDWLYDLACAYAIGAEVATKHPQLKDEQQKQLSETYARRALELLEKAIQAGFLDYQHLRKDPDFDFINQSQRFRRLLPTS